MRDTVRINGVIFEDVEYIRVPKYVQPADGEEEPPTEYAVYRHTRNLTSPINIAEVFAGTATEINDFNGEINGVLGPRIMNNNDAIQSIILPAVTSTSGETCRYCDNLRYVKMDSCVTISYRAFRECPRLEEVDFPAATSLADDVFEACYALNTCNFPLVMSVGQYCFYNCNQLASLSLPSCKTINHQAFYGCSLLETLDVPNLVNINGSDVFSGCNKLLNQTFPKVTSFGSEYTFRGARFEEAVFPAYASAVRYRAFRDATAVKSVRFPLGTGVDSQAFYNCTALKSAYIQKATWIGGTESFYNCTALEKLVLGNYFCTLGNTNVFTNSSIANGTGNVYVGLYFLEKIRNAANWAGYAAQILPLEMLDDNTATEYTVTLVLPANCKPKIHIETSKCELDFNVDTKVVLGAAADTLQYRVDCDGFVAASGSVQVSDADTNVAIDLSSMQADANFNGFSLLNLNFMELPVDRSNYATISVNGFSQYGYENYYDKGGISFSNNNFLTNTITFPDYSGMTNPVFLWEAVTDIKSVLDNGGVLYSMGGSNSNNGTIAINYGSVSHYANGSRMTAGDLDLVGVHHVAMAVTADTVYVYVDGELIGSYNDTYLINGMKYTTPRIGNNQSNTNEYFHGKLLGLCQTVRDVADPSVYANCGFMLGSLVPQPQVEEQAGE